MTRQRLLLRLLHFVISDPALRELEEDFENQIQGWRENPFNPYPMARLRVSPYQLAVVMKYIDNLIAWGDQLFRRDTIESINEATQLYVLAAEILGNHLTQVPSQQVQARTYDELRQEGRLDELGSVPVKMESAIDPSVDEDAPSRGGDGETPRLWTLYFCIPPNHKMLRYRDTLADRLFKIRHRMTIEGVAREQPLLQPPIEPGMLVRAAKAGVDLAGDLSAPQPNYRARVRMPQAVELCTDVKPLGAALLSALENGDAEQLALPRSQRELRLLDAVRQSREGQVEEADQLWADLQMARDVAAERYAYYTTVERTNRTGYSRREQEWILQAALAAKELERVDRQIAAAEIRKAIAQRVVTGNWVPCLLCPANCRHPRASPGEDASQYRTHTTRLDRQINSQLETGEVH